MHSSARAWLTCLDGAFEFSLGEQYIHMADFARFDAFIANYSERYPLTAEERDDLAQWIGLVGLIKFIKEIRVLLQRPGSQLRTKRALLIGAVHLVARQQAPLTSPALHNR